MLPRRSKKRIALKKLPIIIKCKRKDVISYITLNMYLYQNNHYIVSTDGHHSKTIKMNLYITKDS